MYSLGLSRVTRFSKTVVGKTLLTQKTKQILRTVKCKSKVKGQDVSFPIATSCQSRTDPKLLSTIETGIFAPIETS